MKLAAYLLLFSQIHGISATDEFASIPLRDSVRANRDSAKEMSLKFNLQRHNAYQDIVKNQLFSSFLQV